MKFKSHPYYDQSDANDWLSLRPDDWTPLERGPEKTLDDMLRADRQWLCELALAHIRAAAEVSYLLERPHPDVHEFLFVPIGDRGFKVYIEYFFYQRPDQNSPDSDFWWVIIHSPYVVAPFPTGRREDYVTDLGWAVA
jgi:hypothetical protein